MPFQMRQRAFAARIRQRGKHHILLQPRRRAAKLRRRVARHAIDLLSARRVVKGQKHRETVCAGQQRLQNRQLLRGKIRKAPNRHGAAFCIVTRIQRLAQPIGQGSRILLGPLAQCLIGLQNEAQLLQLLPKRAGDVSLRPVKRALVHAVALQLVHHVKQLDQKLRLRHMAAVDLQPRADLL